MKPVLVVKGQKSNLEVTSVNFDNGIVTEVMTWDKETRVAKHVDIDETNQLIWEGRYQQIIDLIQKRIDGLEENQFDLATRFIEDFDELPEEELSELKRDYHHNASTVNGLIEALGIIEELKNPSEHYTTDKLFVAATQFLNGLSNNA